MIRSYPRGLFGAGAQMATRPARRCEGSTSWRGRRLVKVRRPFSERPGGAPHTETIGCRHGGAVAQVVERSLSMWEVRGSIPRSSSSLTPPQRMLWHCFRISIGLKSIFWTAAGRLKRFSLLSPLTSDQSLQFNIHHLSSLMKRYLSPLSWTTLNSKTKTMSQNKWRHPHLRQSSANTCTSRACYNVARSIPLCKFARLFSHVCSCHWRFHSHICTFWPTGVSAKAL